MSHEASGRFALIIATGMMACLFGPLQAAPAAAAPQDGATQQSTAPVAKKKTARPHAKHVKKKSVPAKQAGPTAENTRDQDKTKDQSKLAATPTPAAAPQDEARAAADAPASASLPASIANANAQFPEVAAADGVSPGVAPAATAPAGSVTAAKPAADVPVAAPDEVNELDRAAAEATPATAVSANAVASPASAQQPTVGTAQVASANDNDGAWDKASLVGKIFIAAGGLLTLASAARMFIA